MITSQPQNWKDLQDKVNFILDCVGLNSEKEKIINTPRGNIEIDVYAVDENSIDKIKYVIECKNWNSKVPQSTIHSFTTVMHETGANIGYIISKKGFQKGAFEYVKYTNIKLFSYTQFQEHYFINWYKNYFAIEIFKANDHLIQFTEPFNYRRFRYQDKLNEKEKIKYEELLDKYSLFSNLVLIIGNQSQVNINIFSEIKSPILKLSTIEKTLFECFNQDYSLENYIIALETLKEIIKVATNEFIDLFKTNIFFD